MKIVKSFEESGLMIKGAGATTENEAKLQEGGFISKLLGTIDPGLLGNLFTGKSVHANDEVIQSGEGTNRAWLDF